MLVHDTMLNGDSYVTGTSDTPLCDCGKENVTVDLLLRSSNHEEARRVMMDYGRHRYHVQAKRI